MFMFVAECCTLVLAFHMANKLICLHVRDKSFTVSWNTFPLNIHSISNKQRSVVVLTLIFLPSHAAVTNH